MTAKGNVAIIGGSIVLISTLLGTVLSLETGQITSALLMAGAGVLIIVIATITVVSSVREAAFKKRE